MRIIFIAITLAISVNCGSRAASIMDNHATVAGDFLPANGFALSDELAPILPGFDSAICTLLPVSTDAVTPSATFSVAMKKAFLTPGKITLAGNDPGSGSHHAARRIRSVIGTGPSALFSSSSSFATTSASADAPSTASGSSAFAPIPEPGTMLTGLMLLGVCAAGSRTRCRRTAVC